MVGDGRRRRGCRPHFLRALPSVLVAALSPSTSDALVQPITALAPFETLLDGQVELVGVAVMEDGTVYVAERSAGVIYRLASSAQLATAATGLDRPAGLAFDTDGRLLIAEERAGRVLRLEPSGTLTVLATGIKTPRWLVVAPDGAVYISAHRLFAADGLDTTEGREILRLRPDGVLAVVATGIRRLEGLALLDDSLIAATKGLESGPDSAGTLLRYPILGDGGLGAPVTFVGAGLKQPVGIVPDHHSALYLSSKELFGDVDPARRAIGKVRPDLHVTTFAQQLEDPQGVAFGPDGSLYLADGRSGRLVRFRAPPAPTLTAVPAFTTRSPLAISGTTEPNSRIDIVVNEATTVATGSSGTAGAFNVSVPLVLNDANDLEVFATPHGGDGLTSPAATPATRHDDVAPGLVFQSPPAGAHLRGLVTLQVQASDGGSEVASLALSVNSQPLEAALAPAPPAPSVTATASWTTTNVGDGAHTLGAAAADRAQNLATVNRAAIVDNTPPDTEITQGPTGATSETAATFAFTGTDNLALAEHLQFAYRLDDGPWSAFAPATSATFTGLVQGAHVFRVKARDRAGNEDPTAAERGFTIGSLRVTITEPADGVTVPAGAVVVRGTIDAAGGKVGVAVNGVPAAVQGTVFAAQIAVDAETTSLTAAAATGTGATASHAIDIVVVGAADSARVLLPDPRRGVGPLTVSFALHGVPGPASVELDADGDGVSDFVGANLRGLSFTYATPGVYLASVMVTDMQGQRTTLGAVVEVFDRAGLDTVFQDRWAAFRQALARGDIDGAAAMIVGPAREKYRGAFQRLGTDLPAMAADLRDLVLQSIDGATAEYLTTQDRDGATFVHFVYFMRDEDGLWKIAAM